MSIWKLSAWQDWIWNCLVGWDENSDGCCLSCGWKAPLHKAEKEHGAFHSALLQQLVFRWFLIAIMMALDRSFSWKDQMYVLTWSGDFLEWQLAKLVCSAGVWSSRENISCSNMGDEANFLGYLFVSGLDLTAGLPSNTRGGNFLAYKGVELFLNHFDLSVAPTEPLQPTKNGGWEEEVTFVVTVRIHWTTNVAERWFCAYVKSVFVEPPLWHWGTWSASVLGWAGVGLGGLRGLFQLLRIPGFWLSPNDLFLAI